MLPTASLLSLLPVDRESEEITAPGEISLHLRTLLCYYVTSLRCVILVLLLVLFFCFLFFLENFGFFFYYCKRSINVSVKYLEIILLTNILIMINLI